MPTFYTFSTIVNSKLELTSSSSWSIAGEGKSTSPYFGGSNIQGVNNGFAFVAFRTTGKGYLYWDISVSSETNYDFGSLTIGGVEIFKVSGVQTLTGSRLVENNTTIQIAYSKDATVNSNLDRTYINSLYFDGTQSGGLPLSFDDTFVPIDYFSFGNLSSWGFNSNAQLGLNDYNLRNTPTKVFYNFNNWKKVSAGENFASAVNSDGYLYIWGFGADGQLGNGSDDSSTIPLILSSQNNFIDVSCGQNYIGAVKSDGSIWMWGNGSDNQLGNSSTNSSLVPIQLITSFSSNSYIWKKISCGYNYCFAVTNYNELWSWGNNTYGQLGSGNYTNRVQAQRVGSDDDWESVSCGKFHTVGIKTDRSLYATGDNTYGQLGTENLTNRVSFIRVGTNNDWKQVSCGQNHTIAIKTNGTMWAWGNNDSGQLGFGVGIASTSKPIQVGSDITWKQVSCGSSSSSAVKTDGSLWVWGLNTSDQLGLGDSVDDVVYDPTQIGTEYNWKQVSTRNSNFYAIKYNNFYI